MSWIPLSQRLGDLPLILAGPILRRTEKNSVTVWLALREPGTVTLRVFEPNYDDPKCDLRMSGELATLKMGDHLHIVAVTATTSNASKFLQPSIDYTYDIELRGFTTVASGSTLATPQVFSCSGGLNDILYTKHPTPSLRELPSFRMPPNNLADLHILHGSCRKPHGGEGGRDALPYADYIIGEYMGENEYGSGFTTDSRPNERPHQFYHTGDQIYADDVAETLLFMLDDASKTLFGWAESFAELDPMHLSFANENTTQSLPHDPNFVANTPAVNGNVSGREAAGIKYSLQPGQRIDVAQRLAGFSSDLANGSGSSHLMRLGEYSCMYLFAWSNVLWPTTPDNLNDPITTYPSFQQVIPWAMATAAHNIDSPLKQKYDSQIPVLAQFCRTLTHVRRVLANVPSYMMCDDHEVTDDWFIGIKWCDRVYGSELGRRIVQNGLTAFAVFQAWGNKPNDFITGNLKPESILLDQIGDLATDRGQTLAKWDAIQGRVLPARRTNYDREQGNVDGLETSELMVDGVPDYSFSIVFDKFALLAINSRTERGHATDQTLRLGAALLHPTAMRRQVTQQVVQFPATVQLTLVICPAPVFGHAIIEGQLQQSMALLDKSLVSKHWLWNDEPLADTDWNETSDREGWSFHPECMQSLLKELSPCKKVVLFSGDVHYGFSPQVAYHRRLDPGTSSIYPAKAAFVQLVGSSMKNATQVLTVMFAGNLISRSASTTSYHYAGWDKPGYHHYDHIQGDYLNDVKTDPLYHTEQFHLTELQDPVDDLYDPVNDPPRWGYSITYARDDRNMLDRFTYHDGHQLDNRYYVAHYPPLGLTQRAWNAWLNNQIVVQNVAVGYNQINQFRVNLAQDKVYHNFWFEVSDRELESQPGPATQHQLTISSV